MSELIDKLLETQPSIELEHGYFLSPITRADKAAYLEHFSDPTISKNLLLVPYPYTEENADFWVDLREKEAKNPESFFAIRRPDGYLIGAIGTGFDGKSHTAEFGYWICEACRGLNIMPLAIQKFALHAFRRLAVHRLQATIFQSNEASARALIKAGFTREGVLRDYYLKNGEYIDGVSFSLLDTDRLPQVFMKKMLS